MLNSKDRDEILKIIKSSSDARVIYRANALNLRHKGFSAAEVADILEITSRTVFNIQRNYEEGGLEKALHDDPRPGQPQKFDDGTKAKVVALVCSDPPEGFDRWTLELLQQAAVKEKIVDSISLQKISVILREHDLKPWLQKSWCVPDLDAEFIERMEDVLEVYAKSYGERNPLVCLDEKPIQLLEDVRPESGIAPGKIKKIDFEYKRNGTANVFCAVEPQSGNYTMRVTNNRKSEEFAKFLASIARRYESAKKITLVMDNLSTHTVNSLIKFYGEEEGKRIWSRFDVHYTPKHGSWLNQAEIAINIYSRQCLGKTRIPDMETLRKKTAAWSKVVNRLKPTIKWKFTTQDAREKFQYL
jgi:transposase